MKKFLLFNTDNKEEEVFSFSLDNKSAIQKLEWEGDDEFNLDGEMYDVIEKKIGDGKLIIRCISDKKETILLKNYGKINNEGNSKSKSALLLKLVDNSSYLSSASVSVFIKNISISPKILFQSEIISSYEVDVLTPPPQVC